MTELEAEKRAANTARRPRFSQKKQMAGQRRKKGGGEMKETSKGEIQMLTTKGRGSWWNHMGQMN